MPGALGPPPALGAAMRSPMPSGVAAVRTLS